MLKEIEKSKLGSSEASDFETLELKANLTPEQRAYLEVLKDKMKKILGNKTKQELAKAGDLDSLKNYKAVLEEILDFLRTKERKVFNWDDPELIKKQIEIIDIKIRGNRGKSDRDTVTALERQKSTIKQLSKNKTYPLPDFEVKIDAKRIFKESEVLEKIKEIAVVGDEDLFLIGRFFDSHGNLVYLNLGMTGYPQVQFEYCLAGNFTRVASSAKTIIAKCDVDIKSFNAINAAQRWHFDEQKKKWV